MMKRKTLAVLALCGGLIAVGGCNDRPAPAPSAPMPPSGAPSAGSGPVPALDVESKISMYQDVLRQDPKNVNALVGLGNLLMDSGRYPEAIDAYAKALEIEPSDVNVRTDMGTCYRRIGRPQKAVEAYRKSLSYQPEHSQTLINLGVVLLNDLDRPDEALEVWEKFLKADPAHRMAEQIRQEVARLKAAKKSG